jgi:hypothetical protein
MEYISEKKALVRRHMARILGRIVAVIAISNFMSLLAIEQLKACRALIQKVAP